MNKKVVFLIISIFSIIVVLSSTSYALVFKEDEVEPQAYSTGILEITSESTNDSVTLSNSIPMSDEDGGASTPYTFKITNTGNLKYKFDVKFLSTTLENQILSEYIKIKVNDKEPVKLNSLTEGIIMSDCILNSGQYIEITLRVWLDEFTPNTEIGKTFNAKITTEGEAIYTVRDYSGYNIYDMIGENSIMDNVSSTFVSSSEGINFFDKSSEVNGKGVYTLSDTAEDDFPIYYYRGNVNNNNVLFGNFCWKIIRTTDTGGTKLIYNGVPVDGKCDNMGDSTVTHNGINYSNSSSGLSSGGYSYTETERLDMNVITTTNIPAGTIFASNIEYVEVTDATTGTKSMKYRLIGDKVTSSSNFNSERETLLQNHHYTCLSTTLEQCDEVNYFYMVRDHNNYYAVLSNGLYLDDLLKIEFNGTSTNATKSTVHTTIESWYASSLISFNDYIEDTVYCNDRSLYQPWTNTSLVANTDAAKTHFGSKARIAYIGNVSVDCPYVADSFTVNEANGNGVLTYPVGLINFDEANLAGFAWGEDSEDNYLYNDGGVWWSMSPGFISATGVYMGVIYSTLDHVAVNYKGSKDANGVYSGGRIRPVISLKYGMKISGGYGSVEEPFTIEELPSEEPEEEVTE